MLARVYFCFGLPTLTSCVTFFFTAPAGNVGNELGLHGAAVGAMVTQ